jgi:hypothetical protein
MEIKRMRIEENRPFGKYKDRYMTDTNHAIDRSYEREKPGLEQFPTSKSYRDKHLLMIGQAIHQILRDYRDHSGVYILYSRGTGLGLVIDWRHDWYDDDGKNHAYVMTVLPPSPRPHYKKHDSDIRIFVEIQDRLESYVLQKQVLKEEDQKGYTRYKTEEGFTVHLYDGKIMNIEFEKVLVE